jgi:hypothetical protein
MANSANIAELWPNVKEGIAMQRVKKTSPKLPSLLGNCFADFFGFVGTLGHEFTQTIRIS